MADPHPSDTLAQLRAGRLTGASRLDLRGCGLHQLPPEVLTLAARLQALRSGGSTRLGAALRHATARLAAQRGRGRDVPGWVLLLSDGEPHDIDVHDPRYLVDDARHAVREGQRRGVRMACLTLACLTLGGTAAPQALRIFGRHGTQTLADPAVLPRALRRLVA